MLLIGVHLCALIRHINNHPNKTARANNRKCTHIVSMRAWLTAVPWKIKSFLYYTHACIVLMSRILNLLLHVWGGYACMLIVTKWQALSYARTIHKFLLIVSVSLFVISVFLPWLIERSQSPLAINPPIRHASHFWSFQVVMDTFLWSENSGNSVVLRLGEYWFLSHEYAHPVYVFQGWLLAFVFQTLGILTGAIAIVTERVKGRPPPLIWAITFSALSLLLCCFQAVRQLDPARGHAWTTVNLEIGFALALASVILWLVSLRTKRLRERISQNAHA